MSKHSFGFSVANCSGINSIVPMLVDRSKLKQLV
jgi:hypothetical protein